MGVIYKSNHEDFSEFRSLLLTAQTRFLSAKIQQSSKPPDRVLVWGLFFRVHGIYFAVYWEKQNVQPNTGVCFTMGFENRFANRTYPEGFLESPEFRCSVPFPRLTSVGEPALSVTRGPHEKIRVNRGSLWERRWRKVRRTYLRAADGGIRSQRCGQNANYDVASNDPAPGSAGSVMSSSLTARKDERGAYSR